MFLTEIYIDTNEPAALIEASLSNLSLAFLIREGRKGSSGTRSSSIFI